MKDSRKAHFNDNRTDNMSGWMNELLSRILANDAPLIKGDIPESFEYRNTHVQLLRFIFEEMVQPIDRPGPFSLPDTFPLGKITERFEAYMTGKRAIRLIELLRQNKEQLARDLDCDVHEVEDTLQELQNFTEEML